jgi:TonB-dependent SusC/RagA subfamily outer membrane receptor
MTSPRFAAISACLLFALASACASGGKVPEKQPKETITSKDIDRSNSGESIEKMLQDKVSGLLVTRTPDGGIALQIRGMGSALGDNTPLYVIDEVPMQAGPGGALVGVNPHDIDTIQVLKNPADTGRYGIRGANGVILITTKRPGKKSPGR